MFCLRVVGFILEIERRVFVVDSINTDTSIEALENGRNLHCAAIHLREEIDASRFSGTRTMFCWRAAGFTLKIERRFFDAESINTDCRPLCEARVFHFSK